MFCRKCGKELTEGARFCTGCGAEVIVPEYTENVVEAEESSDASEKVTIAEVPSVIKSEIVEKQAKENKVKKTKENKAPKGKKLIIIIVAIVAALGIIALLIMAGTMKNKPVSEAVNIEEDAEKSEEESVEESEEEEPVEEIVDDPLADYPEVDFTGDKGRDDNDTRKLVAKLIEDESVDPGKILSVCCSDFAEGEESSAFVFTGEFNGNDGDEYAEEYYEGECYFVSEDSVVVLDQPFSEIWHDTGRLVDCGSRKFYFINEHYTTALVTQVWTVRDGKPVEDGISGCGMVYESESGEYEIVCSIYDVIYDREIPGMLGHSWKPYYCDYDESKGMFVEYAGVEVELDQVKELCGRDIINELYDKELYVLNAFVRDNGILNINYLNPSDADVTFGNVTFDMNTGKMVRANDYGGSELEEADYGGLYLSAFTGSDQVLPDDVQEPEATETYIIVYTNGNLIEMGGYQILYGMFELSEEELVPRAFVIDGDTKLADGLGGGYDAMEWLNKLANPTEEMALNGEFLMGVFGMTTTGSHVDSIDGQYWWD